MAFRDIYKIGFTTYVYGALISVSEAPVPPFLMGLATDEINTKTAIIPLDTVTAPLMLPASNVQIQAVTEATLLKKRIIRTHA